MARPFTHQAGHGTTTLACKLEPYEFTKALQHKSVLYVGEGGGGGGKKPRFLPGYSVRVPSIVF